MDQNKSFCMVFWSVSLGFTILNLLEEMVLVWMDEKDETSNMILSA